MRHYIDRCVKYSQVIALTRVSLPQAVQRGGRVQARWRPVWVRRIPLVKNEMPLPGEERGEGPGVVSRALPGAFFRRGSGCRRDAGGDGPGEGERHDQDEVVVASGQADVAVREVEALVLKSATIASMV